MVLNSGIDFSVAISSLGCAAPRVVTAAGSPLVGSNVIAIASAKLGVAKNGGSSGSVTGAGVTAAGDGPAMIPPQNGPAVKSHVLCRMPPEMPDRPRGTGGVRICHVHTPAARPGATQRRLDCPTHRP